VILGDLRQLGVGGPDAGLVAFPYGVVLFWLSGVFPFMSHLARPNILARLWKIVRYILIVLDISRMREQKY